MLWLCENNHECKTTVRDFISGKRCKRCAKYGFDPSKSGYFYIVRWYNSETSYLKYGITNKEVLDRIKQQSGKSTLNYNILYTFYSNVGQDVLNVENQVKDIYGRKGFCPKELLPDGFTETVEDTEHNLETIVYLTTQYPLQLK